MLEVPTQRPGRATSWELLGGLRFLLAWIVLTHHLEWFTATSVPWVDAFAAFGGKAAVVGFLLVSGYSIGASLGKGSGGFYRRRFLRIYPLYFFTILFSMILEHVFRGHLAVPGYSFDAKGWPTAVGNFLLLQTFVVKPVPFDPPVWSLSIEVAFYVIAPFLGRLRRNYLMVVIVLSAICFLLPAREGWGYAYYVLSRLNALKFLWCWLLGFLLWRDAGAPATILALACAPLMLSPITTSPLCFMTYFVSLGAILVSSWVRVPKGVGRILNDLGDLSYPLYLFHLPTMVLAYGAFGVRRPEALAATAVGVSVFALWAIDGYVKREIFVPLLMPTRVPQRAEGGGALARQPGSEG